MASEPGKLNKKGIWIVAGVVIFIFYSMTNKRDKEVPTVSTAASVVAPEPRVAPPPPPVEEATRDLIHAVLGQRQIRVFEPV